MQKKIYIYVDNTNNNFPGFSIITSKIINYVHGAVLITDISNIEDNEIIIPVGVVASNNLIKAKRDCKISFLMDSPTLCFKSIILFYLRRRIFFKGDILMQLARLIKYYSIEKKIIKTFEKVIVVSHFDQLYLENEYKCSNVLTISNGVEIPSNIDETDIPHKPILGFLYYWGVKNSLDDIDWFVKSYLPKLRIKFPDIEIVAAGKGATKKVENYFKKHDIKYIGEVNHLNEFYSQINIYITTVRKECGILNKVLDAMAHRKIVVALKGNMHAFEKLREGYYTYNNIDELISIINNIVENPQSKKIMESNCIDYINTYHSWKRNYGGFKELIYKTYNI